MPISSFYGMQTSLRGLMAQQRMLDTTGHNIANASTQGYSRQEGTLAASQALQLQATAGPAHLGSGVDVQGFRRVRDQFLDLQFRGQNTSLSEWSAKAEALNTAELALAEPGDNGINAQLTKFWSSWADLANHPSDSAAKQVVVEQAGSLTDAIKAVRGQMVAAQDSAQAQYKSITGAGGDIQQIAGELAGLNKTISAFVTNGDSPNDLMDRRDMLLDKLSTYGQVSVKQLDDGSQDVSFVGSPARPIVGDKAVTWIAPPTGDWASGGQLGGLQSVIKSPGGTMDDYLTTIDTFAAALGTAVNLAYGGDFFTVGTPAGDMLEVAAPIKTAPASIRSGTVTAAGEAGSNNFALAVSQLGDKPNPALAGSASVNGFYRAFVAKVGADLNESTRMQANAQVLTDSVEDHRQSVAGVSMDEEMSNLVRFQRAYQASARAMSTMDEMLDVLINRTGRVGL